MTDNDKQAMDVTTGEGSLDCFVRIFDLWCGDRFETFGAVWTYLGATGDGETGTARKHSIESRNLGPIGYGYRGDSICSFDLLDKVRFIFPNVPSHVSLPEMGHDRHEKASEGAEDAMSEAKAASVTERRTEDQL